MVCNMYDSKPARLFFGNPAFGGRGVGIQQRHRGRRTATFKFNASLGFPGEGWSAPLRLTTWNTRGLTYQRFTYWLRSVRKERVRSQASAGVVVCGCRCSRICIGEKDGVFGENVMGVVVEGGVVEGVVKRWRWVPV